MFRFAVCAVLLVGCGDSGMGAGDDVGGGGDDDTMPDGGNGSDTSNTPHTVKLTLTNRPMNAQMFSFLVAYQDGGAAWTLAPAPTGDTYTFDIHAPSYGVAFTCIGTQFGTTTTQLRTVTAAHFAIGERTELTLDVPARCSDRNNTNPVTLAGNVTNRPFGGFLTVTWGNRSATVGSQTGGFQLQAQAGTHDLVVAHSVPVGNGNFYVDRAWVARDVALTTSTMRQINFSEADDTQQFAVDTSNINQNARVTASTTLYTANATQGLLVRESDNPESIAFAENQQRTSDVYDQSIAVSTLGRGATITHATNAPDEQTWQAPMPVGAPQTTVSTAMPYAMLQTTWPAYSGAMGYVWSATQQLSPQQCGANSACAVVWSAILSPGVTGNMPGYQMPDLSALTGWKPAWQLVAGTQIVGSVTAFTSSAGASDFPPGIPASGTDRVFVRADYAVTP
jgi:hypothetical protein